ncbi:MAG: GNAT family N-acetyltransferase [Verrucomicrobiales bacterium]|nr:GNAT family N-acetyltransferase [Verrucomicrobiales bacterium]
MSNVIFRLETGDSAAWDRWVSAGPDPHHEQMAAWGDAQSFVGWTALRLVGRKDGSLVGGVQILEKPIRRFGKVGYVNRGPLMAGTEAEGIRGRLAEALAGLAKERHYLYLVVVLPYGGSHMVQALEGRGFMPHPAGLPPVRYMTDTACLALAATLDDILAGMRSSTRKHIRQGLKRGLKVRMGDEADLKAFDALLDALCERRGARRNIPRLDFLVQLWRGFQPSGGLRIFVAEHAGVPIAALLVFTLGEWVREWRIGWNGEHAELLPNELLRWEVIRWAKERGFRWYDFSGIDATLARKVATGAEILPSEMTGPSWFKLGFGGRPIELSSDYSFFPNPALRLVMRRFGAALLARPTIQGWIRSAG